MRMTAVRRYEEATRSDTPAVVRAEVIRRSLWCFAWGCCGLVPLVGLPFAVMAWAQSNRALRGLPATWNPAERYRLIGVVLAWIGLLSTAIGLAVALLAVSGALG